MTTLSEAEIEGVLLDQLLQLGYSCLNDAVSGPDGHAPEREAYSDTILAGRLRDAIARLNPQIPDDAREDALRQVIASDRPSLIEENRRLHRFLVEGVPVEYRADDGAIRGDAVRLVDPADAQNDWLAIAQFTVIENGNNRRPDVVVFLNGLPVGVIEVKKPGAENATLAAAFNQLQTYKAQIPSASDTAREVRDEVGFFQTVRAAMVKAADTSGRSAADRDLAIRQIVNDAVASTEIVDILSAAGLSSPDISILSDDFLAEVGQIDKKNLALEALKKLLNDEIRSRSRSNVIETRKFSERLEEAIARYHTNAISTVEVLQELIALAKDVRDARSRGEEAGLTPEEVAFYDALADNQSAVDVLGNDQLKIIAHELLTGLKANVSIDWAHRDSARARLRVLVKRILRKYGYPPDLEEAAVGGVLAQAEAMLSEISR